MKDHRESQPLAIIAIANFLILRGIIVVYFLHHDSAAAMSSAANANNQFPPVASANVDDVLAKNNIDFLMIARGLKTTERTGWVLQQAGPRIESVADHSWRIGLMAMIAASSSSSSTTATTVSYDTNRCVKMALVHDLAEATVGDITPHCGVSDDDKHARELRAMTEMTRKLTQFPGGVVNPPSPSSQNADVKDEVSVSLSSSSSQSPMSSVEREILELWQEVWSNTGISTIEMF